MTTSLSRSRSLLAAVAVVALVVGCVVTQSGPGWTQAPAAQERAFTFGVIGDLGYQPHEEPWLANVLADLNRDTALAFVVHVGDLSSARFACTEELRARRLAQFRASLHPFIYTPGDNEWTDCREPTIKGGDPLERLAKLRAVFFDGDRTLGQRTFALTRQSDGTDPAFARYRENARWALGGVTFLTLHVTGSNNGRGYTKAGDEEFAERNRANLAWLQRGFEHATRQGAGAVVIFQQGNPFHEFPPFPGKPQNPSGFADLRAQLAKEAAAFGKPVVLIHGDSHFFRVDKPLSLRTRETAPAPLENFTRAETFGSPFHHWLHVTVDPQDPGVFTFRPRLVAANLHPRQ